MAKYGFGAINDGSKAGLTGVASLQNSLKINDQVKTGRVISVVLDDSHPRYTELGGPKAIGAVEFTDVKNAPADYSTTSKQQSYNVAFPLYSTGKTYPLINEIVALSAQPSKQIQERSGNTTYYYSGTVNLWNHPHHNAIPYSAGNSSPLSSKSNQEVELGLSNKRSSGSGNIKLGNYFQERTDINPLKPFEGDFLLEGRFGNTLRLGSTGGNNPWSDDGDQGNPITILRNGQGQTPSNSWELITEDINTDSSSIYLTSNQKIPFNPASINDYYSYEEKPQAGDKYTENQIILNSGRLFLNSNSDHILLSSAKTINLNAVDGIHFDTTADTIIQSGRVLLGSKSADEPLLLGDATVSQLQEMLNILKELLVAASTAANAGGPLPTLNSKAIELLTRANLINLELTKSKRNFTV